MDAKLDLNAEAKNDVRLEYYKEQLAHGRHIEVQRSSIAALSAAFCGAIIGKLLDVPATSQSRLPYSVALTVVGLASWVISAKLYERFRLHNEVARLVRNDIDPELEKYRKRAQETIKQKYPLRFWIHLHIVWEGLMACFTFFGLVTTYLLLKNR